MTVLPRFLVLAALAAFALTPSARACPFCANQGEPLVTEADLADLIILGSVKSTVEPKGDDLDGSSEIDIDTVVKDNAFRGGKKTITIPKYIPVAGDKYKFLMFCKVFKNKLDPYKGLVVKADSDIAKYLKGALELKSAPVEKRLRFAFDYLDNADLEVSNDAYKEFANADYKDYASIAKDLPADRIAKWLEDDKTPGFRFGLYGSMLGHCGTEKHAALLRAMVSDPDKRAGSGVDGLLAGYIMLKPEEGWKYLCGVLGDPKNDFMFRYAALRTARFFYDTRANLIKHDEIARAIAQLLDQKDIADLAIEDLRKWQRWETTDRVLALTEKHVFGLLPKPAFEIPIVRRAILRFAIAAAKENEAAAAYVETQRKLNPFAVKDAEELLRLDQTPGK